MSNKIKFEEAERLIGVLPTLAPRPTATSIRNLEKALFDALEGIPSQQSAEYGYKGMAQQAAEYALSTNEPWQDFPNPGNHRAADGMMNAVEQRDADAVFNAQMVVYTSQENVKQAAIGALNKAVPKQYKRTAGIGMANYKTNQNIRDIMAGLRDIYGVPTPDKKTRNEQMFAKGWIQGEPIEELFHRLEDCFIQAIMMKPAFTEEQLIDKAKSAVQRTGLYSTAMLEWNAFEPAQHDWQTFKQHFAEAYDNKIRTGAGTTTDGNYHGMYSAEEQGDDDDDSLASIIQSVNHMQLANNTQAQATADSISALTAETRTLHAALVATQQQLAMFTRGTGTGQGWPQIQQTQPTIPAYIQPVTQGVPAPAQQAYGGGRGRGRRGPRKGRGGGGRGGATQGVIGSPPPFIGIPPQPRELVHVTLVTGLTRPSTSTTGTIVTAVDGISRFGIPVRHALRTTVKMVTKRAVPGRTTISMWRQGTGPVEQRSTRRGYQ